METTEDNMNSEEIAVQLHPLERKVLPHIGKSSTLDEIVSACGLKEVEVMRALQWLSNKKLITLTVNTKEVILLDRNGFKYAEAGLPETRLLQALCEKKLSYKEAMEKCGLNKEEMDVSIGILKKKGLITIE